MGKDGLFLSLIGKKDIHNVASGSGLFLVDLSWKLF